VTPGPEAIAEAVARLRERRLVAFPTETVYGLGADATNAAAVRAVFRVKGRPADNPLIVHVSEAAMARAATAAWPKSAGALASAFWPGPLTLVLPKSDAIPPEVTAGGSAVAVRMPDHALTLALIDAFGGPLVGPSANPSGYVSPTRPEHVREHFDEKLVLVLDGGPCRAGIESTVVDLTGASPRVLRPGVIGAAQIEAVLEETVEAAAGANEEPGPARSPGRVGAHYRPRTPVILTETIGQVHAALEAHTAGCVVLSPPGAPLAVEPPHRSVAMPGDAEAYGSELYAALREADAAAPAAIVVALPTPQPGTPAEAAVWEAVLERLRRAGG